MAGLRAHQPYSTSLRCVTDTFCLIATNRTKTNFAGRFASTRRWLASTAGATDDLTTILHSLFEIGTRFLGASVFAGALCVLLWMLRHRTVRGGLIRRAGTSDVR